MQTDSFTDLDAAIRTRLAASGVTAEAVDVEVEKVVRRIDALIVGGGDVAFPTDAAEDSAPAPYRPWGKAPPGERCAICGKGGDVKRIKHDGGVDFWHEDCARGHFEKLANPPVKLPELPPDPFDEHGAPMSLDQCGDDRESHADKDDEVEIVGFPPLGARCVVCNSVGLSRQLVRHHGRIDVVHPSCIRNLKAKARNP